jgi:hypothetical protein
MADNLVLNSGSGGATLAADDIAGIHHQRVKIQHGADGSATDVSTASPLPISDAGGSLTVDNSTLAVVGGGTEATAMRVTIASDSTGVVSVDDNGASLTVDNAALSVTGGGVEASALRVTIASDSTGVLSVDDNGGSITVDNAALSVTGGGVEASALRVTIATDSTGVLSVDDNGGSLTVDVGTALPAGTNAIGKLAANSGVDIGDVDVTSVTPGTTASSLGKAEDAGHSSGDVGVMALAVRSDSDASLCGTDLDYTPLQTDANGYLKVNIKAGAGSGGTAATDDAAFTAGSGSGTPAMGFFSADTVDAGDVGVLAMDASRRLLVSIEADNVGIGGGTQYTEDAAAAADPVGPMNIAVRADTLGAVTSTDGDNIALRSTNKGELYVKQTDAVPITDNSGSLTIDNAALSVTGGGVEASALRVTIANDSTGVLSIDDNGGSLTVDSSTLTTIAGAVSGTEMQVDVVASLPAGTNAIGKLASNTGVTIGAVEIAAAQTLATLTTCSTVTTVSTLTGSGIAHDAADSGNPHKIGAKAETALSGIPLVADGDRTDLHAGVDGVLIVRPHCNLEDAVQERTTNTDGASTAFASGLAAPGAGVRIWLTSVTISNSSSSFCTVDIRDGSAGSVLWTFPCPATGGVTHTFNPPLKFTANTAVAFDASAATTTLTISANGFKSKV